LRFKRHSHRRMGLLRHCQSLYTLRLLHLLR